jgi:pimeloyl-ACP methyl ester carboxylesterase
MFADIMPSLAKTRQVIAADLQAHGRTADIDRPLSMEALADDIAGLMGELRIERADVLGYSLGGGAALQMAIRIRDRARKLVLISTPFARNGWFPEVLSAMAQMGPASAEMMKPSPTYQTYARIAPRPEHWPVLVGKVGDLTRRNYDWSKDVSTIASPAMLIFGDADAVRPEHMIEFFHLLGGGKKDGGLDGSGKSKSRLTVLPGATHYDILSSPVLVPTITGFLDNQMR